MVDYGFTSTGFRKKTYSEIKDDNDTNLVNTFGTVDLSPDTLVGVWNRNNASQQALIWDYLEEAISNMTYETASGIFLDRKAVLDGLRRKDAIKATGTLTFTGTAGSTIPYQTRVASGNILFECLESGIIETGETTVDIPAQCVYKGIIGNVGAGAIDTLIETISGISAVTNTNAFSGGAEIERDEVFKARIFASKSASGKATSNAIHAAILATEGVVNALVRVNNTDSVDGDGIPAKSINPVVQIAGTLDTTIENAIALTLHNTIALGTRTYGSESGTATGLNGITETYYFDLATTKEIYVRVTITKDVSFETDGETQIKDAVIHYIGGTDSESTEYAGLGMGESLIYTKLIAAIYEVDGIDDLTLELSTNGTDWVSTNITADTLEFISTDLEKITIIEA